MHEYGWDLKKVLNHTPYQLKTLGTSIGKRISLRSVSLANIIRTAYGADQAQFQEFVDVLLSNNGESGEQVNQQFV
jgi:hypothetical protein